MTARDRRFLALFALANAGGVVAYVPLLTLLLPEKIAELAGDARIEWLSAVTFAGACAASVGNVAFGWASDVAGTRRSWAVAGLMLTLLSYALVHLATTEMEIIAAIIAYQLALNMLLSPLTAWAADKVPDSQKGLLGGLLGLGPPIGALAGVVATLPGLRAGWPPMAVLCLIVAALTAPLLLVRTGEPAGAAQAPAPVAKLRFDFGLLWLARLLVQVAGAVLFAYLLYYFDSLSEPRSQASVARLVALTLLVAFPLTLVLGRLSDRLGPRKPFLAVAAGAAAMGLVAMAAGSDTGIATAGYMLFGCATAVFLALHSTYSMQLLPSPRRRGRDMGILNLTNTLPSLVAPLLALWLVPGRGFAPLLYLLAGVMVAAALCVLLVRRDAQSA